MTLSWLVLVFHQTCLKMAQVFLINLWGKISKANTIPFCFRCSVENCSIPSLILTWTFYFYVFIYLFIYLFLLIHKILGIKGCRNHPFMSQNLYSALNLIFICYIQPNFMLKMSCSCFSLFLRSSGVNIASNAQTEVRLKLPFLRLHWIAEKRIRLILRELLENEFRNMMPSLAALMTVSFQSSGNSEAAWENGAKALGKKRRAEERDGETKVQLHCLPQDFNCATK